MKSFPTGGSGTDVFGLCYHAVSPSWPAELSVTPESLADQLQHLTERGYRGTTFSEAVLGEANGKAVAITFDDGYSSTLQLARPILDRFGIPGTLFVPTDYIGGGPMSWPGIEQWLGTEHEDELRPLSWEQVRELADGGWEIGSHTRTHPRLTSVGDEQLQRELSESRRTCEEMLDRPCRSLAYPYGDHDARVVAAARAAGYEAAGTFPARTPLPTPLAWPRIGVFHHDSQRVFRIKVSPAVRRVRRSRLWGPVVGVLRKLGGRARG